jgi:hypothetical protein
MTVTKFLTSGLAAGGLLVISLTGCGGSDASNAPPVCTSMDKLSTSVQDLRDTALNKDGLSSLQTNVKKIRSSFTQVKTDAKQQFSPQVEAVNTAMSTLSDNLSTAVANPSAATIAPLVTDVSKVGTSIKALGDAISKTC